ncbi:glycosyltransferase [Hymenobacter rubripertinctus]|uniref:Glycosyltransferase n=1 Tax=Hymenobacter rubripertinctus TaxID=2029981 RepID=A0A418R1K3_9BACT|nr:glycosyltransferase [Hymenobacter rubripertinctus]RIY11306.1 glycosyltransferase [Hymenobacter rubripertinctus]
MEHATPLHFHSAHPNNAALPASAWEHLPTPPPGLRAIVVVPAKDEAADLPATLAALAAQTDEAGYPLLPSTFEVLVLANNCRDDTARVVREFAARHPSVAVYVAEVTLPPAEAHVGRARRLLLDEAARRLELAGHPAACLISTDADTRVAPDWLAATFRELAAGAAAVCGRILMADADPACPVRRYQLRDAAYHLLRTQLEAQLDPQPHDPWPRHHQHFGASFALTVTAYRQVGGLPVVPYLEDEALYQALLRHDLPVRHSPAVRVYTSGRQQGRVAVGLSWQLREWASLGAQEALVPNPVELIAELRLRRELREHWLGTAARFSSKRPQTELLVAAMAGFSSFGAFWEWARPQVLPAGGFAAVPLRQAIAALRRELARHSGAAAFR